MSDQPAILRGEALRQLRDRCVERGPHNSVTVTEEGLEVIEGAAADGATWKAVASLLGVGERTMRDVRQRDPRVQDAYDRGSGANEAELVSLLMAKARNGDVVATLFALKARHGWREGSDRDAGAASVAVTIQLPGALSPEQYRRQVLDTTATETDLPQLEGGDDADQ